MPEPNEPKIPKTPIFCAWCEVEQGPFMMVSMRLACRKCVETGRARTDDGQEVEWEPGERAA